MLVANNRQGPCAIHESWRRPMEVGFFFSNPASGRTSGNRGNIEKQPPRPSEEGHGARRYDLRSATSPRDMQCESCPFETRIAAFEPGSCEKKEAPKE